MLHRGNAEMAYLVLEKTSRRFPVTALVSATRVLGRCAYHSAIRKRRRQDQEVIYTKLIGRDDLLRSSQGPRSIFAELPISGVDQLWLRPDPCPP